MSDAPRATIADLLGGFIAYRNLRPIDLRLRGATDALPRSIPRKGSHDHAIVVADILRGAHRLVHGTESASPSRLMYVGDSASSDVRAFGHLCRITQWEGRALIVSETAEPATVRADVVDGGTVLFANRWHALPRLVEQSRAAGYGDDRQTIVVIDIDKTLIGARGRNSIPLDRARFRAALDAARSVSGDAVDGTLLEINLREFDRPAWHPLTADNQDVVAYVALIATSGTFRVDELRSWQHVEQGGFPSLLADLGKRRHLMSPWIRDLHDAICDQVNRGSPTPFRAFRQSEYWATRNAISRRADVAGAAERLDSEIVLTEEVWSAARSWQSRGCVVFGLSDKPDEACFPPDSSPPDVALPLHRIPMPIIGGRR